MKNTILILLIALTLFGCSKSDDTPESEQLKKNEYEIIQIVGTKVIAKENTITTNLYTLKEYNYTIDTLEIKLNSGNGSFSLSITSQPYTDIVNPAPTNIKCHANYIYFSDLKQTWDKNYIQHIFLENKIAGYSKEFTYSDCNIDLNIYPQLFISNKFIPTYAILEQRTKVDFQKITIQSENNYQIGEIITYQGYKYKVLSKK